MKHNYMKGTQLFQLYKFNIIKVLTFNKSSRHGLACDNISFRKL